MKRKKLWIGLSIVALILVVVYGLGSFFFASVLLSIPTQSLEQSQSQMRDWAARYGRSDPMSLEPTTPEEITFTSDGLIFTGSYYDNPQAGDCGVVLLHGYTSTRYSMMAYAPLFWKYGCDLLFYDARAHGNSEGDAHTYGFYEKKDAQQAVEWLSDKAGVPVSHIGLMGVSYGAATSLQAAPLMPDLAFIIADSPYQDLETIVRYQSVRQFGAVVRPFIPGAWVAAEMLADFEVEDVSVVTAVAHTTIPILLIHSRQDEFTPVTHTEAIYAAANPATTVLHITDWDAEHASSLFKNPAQYEQYVADFLAMYAPMLEIRDWRLGID